MSKSQPSTNDAPKKITLALTGASGAHYGLRLLQCLVAADYQVSLLISGAAVVVINTETSLTLSHDASEQLDTLAQYCAAAPDQIKIFTKEDWFAPVASGSSAPRAMVICPASGGSLAAIASGASNNLIERAADVALKERRKLIIVPRETPVSEIHLENMLKLSRMGAIILPASPGFYCEPSSIDDLIDFVVARILDQLGIDQSLIKPWGEA